MNSLDNSSPTGKQGLGTVTPPKETDSADAAELLVTIYQELRQLARYLLNHEKPGQTLQATALVHEAWLRMGGPQGRCFDDRGHFFRAAAEAMRRILIDNIRKKQAARRGGGLQRTGLDDLPITTSVAEEELLAVHESLEALQACDPRKAELVKLRYFAGMSVEEVAQALGVSTPTVKRDWAYARAWLYRHIQRQG